MSNTTNLWNFLAKKGLLQFAKFAVVGALSAVLEISIYKTLYQYAAVNVYIANPIAYTIAVLFNYLLSRVFVFETGRHTQKIEFLAFCGVALVGLGINQLVLYLSMQNLILPEILNSILTLQDFAKIIAIIVTVLWNFTMKKLFVFKS